MKTKIFTLLILLILASQLVIGQQLTFKTFNVGPGTKDNLNDDIKLSDPNCDPAVAPRPIRQ